MRMKEDTCEFCYICNSNTNGSYQNIYMNKSIHSSTRICDLIRKFLLNIETYRQLFVESTPPNFGVICENCFSEINEYDLACVTAQRIERSLRAMLLQTDQIFVKQDAQEVEQLNSKHEQSEDIESDHENVKCVEIDDMVKRSIDADSVAFNTPDLAGGKSVDDKANAEGNNHELDLLHVPATRKRGRPSKRSNVNVKELCKVFNCKLCSTKFTNSKDLKMHRSLHRTEETQTKCTICNFDPKDERLSKEHIELHKGLSPLQCVICKKMINHKRNIIPHMRLHTGVKRYQCDRCGKEYLHKSSFTLHMNYHNNIRPLKCIHCTSRYSTKTDLDRHMRCHSGEKPYSCEICGKMFARRYGMRDHLKTHTNSTADKNHRCQFCDAAFARKSKLNEHLERHHSTKIPHTEIRNDLCQNKHTVETE